MGKRNFVVHLLGIDVFHAESEQLAETEEGAEEQAKTEFKRARGEPISSGTMVLSVQETRVEVPLAVVDPDAWTPADHQWAAGVHLKMLPDGTLSSLVGLPLPNVYLQVSQEAQIGVPSAIKALRIFRKRNAGWLNPEEEGDNG